MRPQFSLDQLTAFLAVVEEGSFSAAGRRIGRVQSAVSYAIGQLEDVLGSDLFDRSGRTPVLTEAGRRLAAEARLVVDQAHALSEVASELREGTQPELRIAVDSLFPRRHLAHVARAFQDQFPAVALRIETGLLGDALSLVREGSVELGACNLAGAIVPELTSVHLGIIRVVSVCAPTHPLASHPPPHRETLLQSATQIVHSERQRALTEDQGVLGSRTWRVTSLAIKLELILAGVGWGGIPLPVAQPHIDRGELVILQPEPFPPDGHHLSLHGVSRRDASLGRAALWIRDHLSLPTRSIDSTT